MMSRLIVVLLISIILLDTSHGTTIRWKPGSVKTGEINEAAATAPRSQKYWDENNIVRPDYAKTDEEVLLERKQRAMEFARERINKEREQQQKSQAWLGYFSFISAVVVILTIGYFTERRIPPPNGRHRNFSQFQSRQIWDKTRQPQSSFSNFIFAILYELQPFRISSILQYPWKTKLRHSSHSLRLYTLLFKTILLFLFDKLSLAFRYISKHWGWKDILSFVLLPFGYFVMLVYLHRLFEAGPFIIIITLLTLIFSMGLSDNANDGNNNTSAYSVFNRGFQSLLGSIDVESLVAQHVGGGGMLAFQAQQNQQNQQHQQNQEDENHRAGLAEPAPAAPMDEEVLPAQDQNSNTSRKSGKKARRKRNIEERRDRQRQREQARELGFVDGNGADGIENGFDM